MKPADSLKLYAGKEGILAFLQSRFIPGIGKVFANKIYDSLGDRLLQPETLLPEDLASVPGIGINTATSIVQAIKSLPVSAYLLTFLFSCGLGGEEITKIIHKYGADTEKIITQNPYDMVEDVWKFSFFKADKIGRKLGIEGDDPRRLQGVLLTAVKMHAERGSLYATKKELFATATAIAKVAKEKFEPELAELISEGRLIDSLQGIYLPVYYNAEVQTAEKLASLIFEKTAGDDIEFKLPETDIEGHYFTEEQKNAIRLVRDNSLCIITGDPGTGKTTTVRGLIRLFEDEGKKVLLTAPTGRSAKKLELIAGASAKTIHRILGFNRGKGYFNKKIDADVLIIDEASLLEQVLFNHLLNALPDGIKIVLVGDVGQLPPIGAGRVLEDLLESGVVPVAKLSRNFRQENGSILALNIKRIKNGEMPVGNEEVDFSIIAEPDDLSIRTRLLEMVTQTLPEKFGIDPADIQIVAPQHDGLLGTKQLNADLQQILQKDSPEVSYSSKKFRLGDRVVQSKNSTRRGVYNGETGKVIDVNPVAGCLTVAFNDGKISTYLLKELGELSLAYATSVHKLQGTETDFVVMPLTMQHENLLYRNLLFTAVSRARKYCALIGQQEALAAAIATKEPDIRNSNLKVRLQNLTMSLP